MTINNVTQGTNVKIWHPELVNLYGCSIGDNCSIGTFVEIQNGVVIGNNVKIQSHTFICEGVVIEDDVFVGHNVNFINDKYPRSTTDGKLQTAEDWKVVPTLIKQGASLGTGCIILCGITIGKNAVIAAGSVVTKDIQDNAVAYGN